MQHIIEKIVCDLIPNSPIQFFTLLPHSGACESIAGVEIPILNDVLVREVLMDTAIKSYAALATVDYRLELYALCDLIQTTFGLSDKDALERVNGILRFELTGEGDLKFINQYSKEVRDLTLKKLEKDNLDYLFPYYFVKNRTGKDLDLTLISVRQFDNLLAFIEREKNIPELNQLDSDVSIKKP